MTAYDRLDAQGIVRWKRAYRGHAYHLDPPFAMSITDIRFSPSGKPSIGVSWAFDHIEINGSLSDDVFDWRIR